MRRLLALGLVAVAVAVAGCSLLVSTSDLTGGPMIDSGTDSGGSAPVAEAGGMTVLDAGDAAALADVDAAPAGDPSLLGAWSFDDGSASDVSGHGHTGRLTGNATIADSSFGKSLQLQGSGSLDVASLSAVLFPATGTYAVRFKWSSMTVDIEDGILDEWEGGRDHLYLRHPNGDPPGTMQVAFQQADEKYLYAAEFDVPKDTWTLVVITWDTSLRKGAVFVNGKALESGTWQGSWTPIDEHMTFGLNLHGLIDDVRLYDRVLSETEITALP